MKEIYAWVPWFRELTGKIAEGGEGYRVAAQHPQKKLATIDGKGVFTTKPDIVLRDGERARYILDAKWKGHRCIGR